MFTYISKVFFFFIISFHLGFFVRKITVFSQEIASSNENFKRYPSNSTSLSSELNRNDRLYHGNDVENKFFIRSNTIIRTGESRALGARYLNETKLSSNQECLTWCLETPSCNAAVYEEKNMQSCYMFDCGSPAKPLCKFTSHNFFMSSLLKMSQHSYELSQWGRQVQQERSNVEHQSDGKTTTPASINVNTVSSSPALPTINEQPKNKGNACHHYQFQCINNSECIAIYNVCDGIPQCPDGSDESSELKCPNKDIPDEIPNDPNKASPPLLDSKAPQSKQEVPASHPTAPEHPSNIQHKKPPPPELKEMPRKDYKTAWPSSYSGPSASQNSYRHHIDDPDGLGSPFIHKHSQFISANDPHVQNLNRWASDYDQYPPRSTSLEQQYNPYEHLDEQYLANQMSSDYDTGKGFGGYHPDDISYWPNQDILQDTSYTADEFSQPGAQNFNKVLGYPDKESAYAQQIARTAEQYPEPKLSLHNKPLLTPNQASDMDDYKLHRYSHARQQQPYLSLEDSLQQRFSNYPEAKAKGYGPLQNEDDIKYSNEDLIRASLVNQLPKKIDQIKHLKEHNLKQMPKDVSHNPTKGKSILQSKDAPQTSPVLLVKPTSHTKTIQRTVLDFKMSVAELYQSSSTHTHEANSAILALVVGVTVSLLLIILLACRLKTLRRRMSRKGRGLAHDADYLVNGMYL